MLSSSSSSSLKMIVMIGHGQFECCKFLESFFIIIDATEPYFWTSLFKTIQICIRTSPILFSFFGNAHFHFQKRKRVLVCVAAATSTAWIIMCIIFLRGLLFSKNVRDSERNLSTSSESLSMSLTPAAPPHCSICHDIITTHDPDQLVECLVELNNLK